MLCSRSASLMSTTRMSSAIARNILRMFSACCSSWRAGAELGQLGDAVHEVRHLRPKRSSTSRDGVLGVLRHVVQQRRLDRERVEAELGQDLGHGQRVGDVRLAATPDAAGRAPPRANRYASPTLVRSASGNRSWSSASMRCSAASS